jgi:aldehyde:ferredoxin oxidoreductase
VECFEKGLISKEQMGREVRFADLETVAFLLEKIAKREGIGDLLAEGVKVAAQRVGKGSDAFAIHVKGLEWSGYECRNAPGMMLAYMTADVGAHHNRAWVLGHDVAGSGASVHDLITAGGSGEKLPKSPVPGKSAKVIEMQHVRPLFDALGVCRLQYMELGFEVTHYEDIFHRVTGRQMSWDDMLQVSERIWHLTRAISVREIEGFGRSFDYPPPRFYTEPVPTGPNRGHCLTEKEIQSLLDEYYQARGWDRNGIPTRETLEHMGLEEVAADMEEKREKA